MRILIVALLALALAGCGTTRDLLNPSPVKFAAAQFTCPGDPGAWRPGASDNEIASNRREAAGANQSCRRQMKSLCLQLAANEQVVGKCEDLPE